MLASKNQSRVYEAQVNRIIGMYKEIIESISPIELEENLRLREMNYHLSEQLRLFRDLARSFDEWSHYR